jgi:hypothetical protein
MSIWCSRVVVGFDEGAEGPQPFGGQVRSYATGWSNHYPSVGGEVEQEAMIDTAHLAADCVPGHDDIDWPNVGPWFRLGVITPRHDWHNPTKIIGVDEATVVMDEAAVRALVAEPQDWLALPKVHPA